MPRPRKYRKTFRQPNIQCFRPDTDNNSKPVLIGLDEFEAIRLKNYHGLSQKESSKIMDISQPTFHRILASAHHKIAKALIEGKKIIFEGGNSMNKKKFKCKACNFEWLSEKEYDKCPDCESEDIYEISTVDEINTFARGRGSGLRGPPRVCKCNDCGYETPKTPGIPCRNDKCPKCGGILCGSD